MPLALDEDDDAPQPPTPMIVSSPIGSRHISPRRSPERFDRLKEWMSNFEAQPPQQQLLKRQPLPNRYGDDTLDLEEVPPSRDRSTKAQQVSLLGQVCKVLKSIGTPSQQDRSRQLMPMYRAKTQREAPSKQRDQFINEVHGGQIGKKDIYDKNKVTRNIKDTTKVVKNI